ncbi:MAG TPA: ComF family protein [Candidatus Paceibacterota bacterium]
MKTFLFDILFPRQCLFCKREGNHCCADCLSLVSIANHPSPLGKNSQLSALFCAASFQDRFAQRLIHQFKYRPFLRDLAKPLAFLIVSHFALVNKPIYPPQVIIPVPLHKRRLKWRGYNHAEELADQLGYAFSVPVAANVLIKRKPTLPQMKLNREQRLKNVEGVFEVKNKEAVQGKTILLVDDVYTTGATMQECARVLTQAGAKAVYGAVVARD